MTGHFPWIFLSLLLLDVMVSLYLLVDRRLNRINRIVDIDTKMVEGLAQFLEEAVQEDLLANKVSDPNTIRNRTSRMAGLMVACSSVSGQVRLTAVTIEYDVKDGLVVFRLSSGSIPDKQYQKTVSFPAIQFTK
jgi:hypothetical protein